MYNIAINISLVDIAIILSRYHLQEIYQLTLYICYLLEIPYPTSLATHLEVA